MRKIDLHNIKGLADNIYHCGDYGQTYIKNDLSEVWVVLGDADEVDLDEFQTYVENYIGAKFIVEAECGPGNEEEYILISRGVEVENFYDDEDIEDGYVIPRYLSLEEYLGYTRLMNNLED